MKASGYNVETHLTALPRLRSERTCLNCDGGLIKFVEDHERGLIRPDLSREVDPIFLTVEIAVAFPDARIVVIVSKNATTWLDGISQFVADCGICTKHHVAENPHRIMIATPRSLGMANIDKAGIVIVADPLVKLADDPLLERQDGPPNQEQWYRLHLMSRFADVRGRLFGIVPRHVVPSPFEAARLAQIFGLDECVIPKHGWVERPVRVVWSKISCPKTVTGKDPLAVKDRLVWNHPVLNRRASALAKQLSAGNYNELRNQFPDVSEHLQGNDPCRVLVLVEGLTHAEVIARRLPGWPVIAQDGTAINSDVPGSPGVIATALGSCHLNSENFDVVLRLDQGIGGLPVPLPKWLETKTYSQPEPLIVIDFENRVHPLLRQWTKSRRTAYTMAGWPDSKQDPDQAAFAQLKSLISGRRSHR
ncbi:MAG: hypothetical protein K8T89_05515 [Planctomycetes bacterium]|nr:hypothetical protein [Planctomycetota bacterium]